ncbi:hypothetical protein CPB84DRAFT_1791318 [Gymnopilus junonius]|uniref:F-box domain-containing protein n=1 Tax=Gymnopilus junonius TaxID=109634 RepID=A0A9P5TIY9_GYMJU|nr:hypothetical protein CPB84DRAFT_1791318 [Gymnopilus junonius]
MQRRSARLPQQPPKNLAEDEFYPEDEELDKEEEGGATPVKKPQNKKRKTQDGNADGQPQPKKPRGKRGILKRMVEMPLDLLFEIFGRLEPVDLLHLARTTKDLRALLMNRSASSIWKAARANIPGLPECPQDLSEPQYADLLFGKNCEICDRNVTSSMHHVWSARLRICTKCVEQSSRFQREDYRSSARGYPSQLEPPILTIIGRRRGALYFDSVIDSTWKAEYSSATDKSKWLKDKLQERKAIDDHAKACSIWFQKLQKLRQQEKESIIDDRKAAVVRHIEKLGWADELSKIGPGDIKIEDNPIIVKACKKNITQQVLSDLEETLNSLMEQRKQARLELRRKTLLKRRLRALRDVLRTYISTLPANSLHPSTGELFRMPDIRGMVYDEESHESLEPVLAMLPQLTVQWQADIKGQLLSLIKTARPDYTFDPDTVFNLATTFFICSSCGSSVCLRYPEVLMHKCATNLGYQSISDQNSEAYYLGDAVSEIFWNATGRIKYQQEYVKSMAEIVQMAGFDPATTSTAEMNSANPIFECIGCNDDSVGRATFSWLQAAVHSQESHYTKKLQLELMEEEQAVIVRLRLEEEMERYRARSYNGMVCVHCKRPGGVRDLKGHVKKEHGKSKVTKEDIIPSIDFKSEVSSFRLWPPRDDDE